MTTQLAESTRPQRVRQSHAANQSALNMPPPMLAMLSIGTTWRKMVIAAQPIFISDCRAFVQAALAEWRVSELADAVTLCTSELATNAMCHGDGAFIGLALALAADTIILEVFDQGTGEPVVSFEDSTEENGRGMLLVSSLSTQWGCDRVHGAWKRVWCTFTLPA